MIIEIVIFKGHNVRHSKCRLVSVPLNIESEFNLNGRY